MHLSAGPVKALASILMRFLHFFILNWKDNLPVLLCFKTKEAKWQEKFGDVSFLDERGWRLIVH